MVKYSHMLLSFTKIKDKLDKKTNLSYKDQLIVKIGREQLKELTKKGLGFKVALL